MSLLILERNMIWLLVSRESVDPFCKPILLGSISQSFRPIANSGSYIYIVIYTLRIEVDK